jgi:hypothetical protein
MINMKNFSELFAKVFGYVIIIIGVVLIVSGLVKNEYDKYQIEKYGKYSIAIVTKVDDRIGRPDIFYEYNIKGVKYNYVQSCEYCTINKGDTILIKYSTKNEDISKVISFNSNTWTKYLDSLKIED